MKSFRSDARLFHEQASPLLWRVQEASNLAQIQKQSQFDAKQFDSTSGEHKEQEHGARVTDRRQTQEQQKARGKKAEVCGRGGERSPAVAAKRDGGCLARARRDGSSAACESCSRDAQRSRSGRGWATSGISAQRSRSACSVTESRTALCFVSRHTSVESQWASNASGNPCG